MLTVAEFKDGSFPIKIEQDARRKFTVSYGLQVKRGLSYEAAAREFGECMFHCLACDSKLDNE